MNEKHINFFEKLLNKENVLISAEAKVLYSYDATAGIPESTPDVILTPSKKEEITQIAKYCNENKIPITPRGSGTNLAGGTIAYNGGVILSMLKLNKILEVDEKNLTAKVQPGVIIQHLNDAALEHDLIYPPDPGTVKTATMGGSLSECSGGLRGLKYGVTKHYILGVEVVLANGDVVRHGGKTYKNVSGFDLTNLFVGAEGTLGIITEIIVKLVPAPKFNRSVLAIFDKLSDAGNCVADVIESKIIPSTMEIMDNMTIRTVENFVKIGLPTEAAAVLIIEVDGMVEEVVLDEYDRLLKVVNRNNASKIQKAETAEERDGIFAARRSALPALAQLSATTILEDATVPRTEIPKMIAKVQELAKKYNLKIGTFGHAGDGNLHPTILADEKNEAEMKRVHKAVDEMFEFALSVGGTLSGEHGIGVAKKKYMVDEFGQEGMNCMRAIKKALDPNSIMNPTKMV